MDVMSDFQVSGPGPGGGGGFTNSNHLTHLVGFVAPEKDERTGSNGPYDVAVCTYVVCATCWESWTDTPVSGKALVPRLLSGEGEIIVGRLTTGEAKSGQNAPILLSDPTPAETEEIQAIFETYAARLPSRKIVFDVDAFALVRTSVTPAPEAF
jgi:hypothetical protein